MVETARPAPAIQAAAGILVDASDGSILWEKDAHQRRAVASTTKILTALVVLEEAELGDQVTVSQAAAAVGSDDPLITQINLVAGEQIKVEDFLYALMLPSGNDAALALAEHVGGSVSGFARMMNERARTAGAQDSNFTNPNGLDDPEAFSTAFDLVQITRAAMANADFRRIVATERRRIPRGDRPPTDLMNRNELLGRVEGASGVKTGNTRMAGRSLVASAERDEEERISVVLGSPDPFGESAALLEFGFDGFSRHRIAVPDRPWGHLTYGDGTTLDLVAAEEVSLLLGASAMPPRTRYRPADRVLVVDARGGIQVPMQTRCPGTERICPAPDQRWSPLAALLSWFAPVLVALR